MNWWDREPNKTTEEQELDEVMDAYEEQYGEAYRIQFGLADSSIRETIDEIKRLIQTGEKQELKEYKEGMLY